ncbi:MAG TPA: hypothetical protein VF299_03540 [Mycobacterium sp.]
MSVVGSADADAAGRIIEAARRDVSAVLPGAYPNSDFRAALRRLHPGGAA